MKRALSLFSMIYLLFTVLSCDISYNEPVKEYLEYWSKAVTIGRYEVASETTVLDGRRNLSAVEPIKVELLLTNPKSYNIELENADGAYFDIYLNDDSSKTNIATSKTATLSSDKTVITLSADIPDNTERKNLMIDGFFIYYKESEPFEIPYSYSFKQLSAPDIPKNLKNPESSDTNGYHTLHFDMPNTSLKRNNDLTYRIDCYSSNTPGEYTFVATADVKADQAKKAGTKSNEFIYYFDEQEPSLQYDYVVTAISPEGVKSKTVSTSESLGLCYVTEPEIIFAGNGELNNLTAEKEGESKAYDVVEYTGDSFSINVVKTDSTSDLDVKVNGQTVDADTVLEDGFNKITATASKNRARPVSVTKNIYVTKKLVEPEITSNAEKNGTKTDNGITYDVMQYSFMTYSNCTYSIDNSANEDSKITFKIDNSTADLSGNLDDGKHELEIIVEKEHCQPLILKKHFNVGIKQITAKLYQAEINISKNTKYSGTIKLYVIGKEEKTVRNWASTGYTKKAYNSYNVPADYYLLFDSKSSKARFETFDSWAGHDPLRDVKREYFLSDILNSGGYLFISSEVYKKDDSYSSENTYHKLWLNLSEGAAPADISFSPALNGVTDNNGFEIVEVADSSKKASYTISSQGNASISGKVDNVSFSGTKSGEFAIGEHTLTVTSKQSGYTDTTITKKIKVVTPISEPTIYFYANNTTNRIDTSTSNSPVPSYTTYDLTLTSSGTGNATMEISAGTGESITVEDGDTELTAKNGRYELALGPHNLSITVSKTGYAPKVINKDIYILGILAEPTVIANNGSGGTGSGNTEDDPKVWKFSYLSDPSLSVYIQPGNTGDNPNTVKVYLDSTDGTEFSNPTSGFSVGYDSVKHLVIVQTRPYCKTKTTHKYVKGIIKPIKLIYHNARIAGGLKGDARICVGGIKNVNDFDLLGEVKFDGATIWGYGESEYHIANSNYWDHLNTDTDKRSYERTLNSPDDKITLEMINMRRRKKEGNFGSHTLQKTLSAIKNVTVPTVRTYNSNTLDPPGGSNGWIFFTGRLTNGNCYMYMYLKFEVEEQN